MLLKLVAHNMSVARGFWVAGHLVNTFLLVAALTLTAWWASGGGALRLREQGRLPVVFALALLGMLVLGVSGAVTALGDTLFPATSLAQAEAQTFSPTAHVFIRLRIWHPTLAIAIGLCLLLVAVSAVSQRPSLTSRKLALALLGLYMAQLTAGLLNVWFLAPVPLQIVHLLLSDLIWISLVLLTASVLSTAPQSVAAAERAQVGEAAKVSRTV